MLQEVKPLVWPKGVEGAAVRQPIRDLGRIHKASGSKRRLQILLPSPVELRLWDPNPEDGAPVQEKLKEESMWLAIVLALGSAI